MKEIINTDGYVPKLQIIFLKKKMHQDIIHRLTDSFQPMKI